MTVSKILAACGIFSGAALLGGCSDFLEREPLDQLSEEGFFETERDINSATQAVYTALQGDLWLNQGWRVSEIPSDNTQPGGTDPDITPIDNFNVTADNGPVAGYWAIRYRGIGLANVVLDRAPKSGLASTVTARYEAEAKFIRALAYFDLVRIYGEVPLVTTPSVYGEDLAIPRSPVADVYALINQDLTEAAAELPLGYSGQDIGRATKGAALALHAKVQLTQRNFAEARRLALEVVALGRYRLLDNYGDLWKLETADNNAETIFQVQFTGCGPYGTGNQMQAFFAPYAEGVTKGTDGWGSQAPTAPSVNNPTTTIVDAFETGDLRQRHTLLLPGVTYDEINPADGGYTYPATGTGRAGVNIKKYVVGGGSNICFMSTPQNGNVLRYADVLLMIAEAAVEIDRGATVNAEAVAAVNQVRRRAGLPAVESVTRASLLHERRVEFAFEQQRWFDILRQGTEGALLIMRLHGKILTADKLLFPIPSAELKINTNLTQNPGY